MKNRIKKLRKDNNLTQKVISKYLNIFQVAYSCKPEAYFVYTEDLRCTVQQCKM